MIGVKDAYPEQKYFVHVAYDSCLNIRTEPSTSAEIIAKLNRNDWVSLKNSKIISRDGYSWVNIKTSDGESGWAALQYLNKTMSAENDFCIQKGCPEGMCFIPPGVFTVGCSIGDKECDNSSERPRVEKKITNGFCMDQTEVTQMEYENVVGQNLSMESGNDLRPVENVTWDNAKDYCNKLGKRLPTEVEWEYAARGGTESKYFWGDEMDGAYAWFLENSDGKSHGIAQKMPNGFGLHDMLGNVWEWVMDCNGDYYETSYEDPVKVCADDSMRILRGGAYNNESYALRVSTRFGRSTNYNRGDAGFRCVQDIDKETSGNQNIKISNNLEEQKQINDEGSLENKPKLVVQNGHNEIVEKLSWSPDSTLIVSLGRDEVVKFWNAKTGELKYTHYGYAQDIMWKPDSSKVAIVSDEITIMSTVSWETIDIFSSVNQKDAWLNSVKGWVSTSKYDSNSSSYEFDFDCTVPNSPNMCVDEVISIKNKKNETVIKVDAFYWQSDDFAVSPDDKMVAATGCVDHHPTYYYNKCFRSGIKIWTLQDGKEVTNIVGHIANIEDISWSPIGDYLVQNYRDAKLWSVNSGGIDATLNVNAENREGNYIVQSTNWDQIQNRFIVFSCDLEEADVAVCFNGITKSWQSGNLHEKGTLIDIGFNNQEIQALSYNADFSKVALMSDTMVVVKNINKKDSDEDLQWEIKGLFTEMKWSEDGNNIAIATMSEDVEIIDTANNKTVCKTSGEYEPQETGYQDTISWSNSGKYIAYGSYQSIVIWDVQRCKYVRSLPGGFSPEWSQDDKYIAANYGDFNYTWNIGDFAIFSTETGEIQRIIKNAYNPKWNPSKNMIAAQNSEDGGMVIVDPVSGAKLAKLFAFDDGNWFVTDGNSHFDCSTCGQQDSSANKYIRWRLGGDLFSPDQFFDEFYRPGLFALIMNGQKVDETWIPGEFNKPPVVTILEPQNETTTADDQITVKLAITGEKANIKDIRLFVNGKRIAGSKTISVGHKSERNQNLIEYNVDLIPGENVIMATAYNSNNFASKQAIAYVYCESKESKKPDLYMLGVGISRYNDSTLDLKYASIDAQEFIHTIESGGKKLFDSIHVTMLQDDEATGGNIFREMQNIANNSKIEDVVVFFFSGHGITLNEQYYFIPYELVYNQDSDIFEKAVSHTQIKDIIMSVKARKTLFVIDTCGSGGMVFAMRGLAEKRALTLLAKSTGAFMIAASSDSQEAIETANLKHGILTHSLIEGLTGAADKSPEDGMITIMELMPYIQQRVPEYAEEHFNRRQYPQVYSIGMDFPLVLK